MRGFAAPVVFLVTLVVASSSAEAQIPIKFPIHDVISPVHHLIIRKLGWNLRSQFVLEKTNKTTSGLDTLEVNQHGNKVRLAGSSATALASAFQWYLKKVANTQTDWYGHEIRLPKELPRVSIPLRMERNTAYSYYQNVCTVSYSMWSWSWEKWEEHIDWMAMNGVNMPLAFTGQEKVWQETFSKHFQVSQRGMNEFFAGAAFLAWGRMGNVRGSWGGLGPLPQSFIHSQFELQTKILSRMREFGMIPAMPGFAGFVPKEMTLKFPNANITRSSNWCGFRDENCCVYVVEPTDPLFKEIGEKFINELHRIYPNSSSLYQCDTFNEMSPKSYDFNYLQQSSNAVYQSISSADASGVWLMQGWLFQSEEEWHENRIAAYLSGVPNDKMIILDLYSDVRPIWSKTKNFFGKSWIFCVLHNFGGNLGIRGDLPTIASAPLAALANSNNTMVGLGLTMEGIYQNYLVYDLTLEMGWASEEVNIYNWMQNYVVHRYNTEDASIIKAWDVLLSSAYNCTNEYGGVTKSIVTMRPKWKMERNGFMPSKLAYNPNSVIHAWKLLLKSAGINHDNDVFRHDLVDVTRQVISDYVLKSYRDLGVLYRMSTASPKLVCDKGESILDMILDMDRILSTNKNFLLGTWLEDAEALGGTLQQDNYFRYQARNQITRWGEHNKNVLADYAGKQWGGLVKSYYFERWKIFLSELCLSKRENRKLNETQISKETERFEIGWQKDQAVYPITEIGNSFSVSQELFQKYGETKAYLDDSLLSEKE